MGQDQYRILQVRTEECISVHSTVCLLLPVIVKIFGPIKTSLVKVVAGRPGAHSLWFMYFRRALNWDQLKSPVANCLTASRTPDLGRSDIPLPKPNSEPPQLEAAIHLD